MAKNSTRNTTNARALQPNAGAYQQRGDANSPQPMGNTGQARSTKRNNNLDTRTYLPLGSNLQPNAASYQWQNNHPGAAQIAGNDQAARAAEASINPALGSGWAAVGSLAQASSNPPGVGPIPTGATGVRTGLNRKLPPQGKTR